MNLHRGHEAAGCIGSGSQNVVHFVTCAVSAGTQYSVMICNWVYCL